MTKRLVWQTAGGTGAGLVAGLAQVVLQGIFGDLPAIARLTGGDQAIPGLLIHLAFSALAGMSYAWLFSPVTASRAESLMSGLAYGLLWWILLSLNFAPTVLGEGPHWHAHDAAAAFPDLLGYLFQGGVLGLGYHVISDVTVPWLGPLEEAEAEPRPAPVEHRIVIVGGGFAGVATVRHLERLLAGDESVGITLVSNTNHLLFTPMLSEVTGGSVEPRHVSTPLRAFFRRTHVMRGDVETVDFKERVVRLATDGGSTRVVIPFDHLVFAVGAVANFFGLKGVEAHGFTFKSLEDAILLRNHVIEMLERADAEADPARSKALTTFVVAGGGFAGAELIGALNDFVRGSLWFYPDIAPEDVSLILVHARDRIIPELSPGLAEYARGKLQTRGVTFKFNTRVADAVPGAVTLSDGETIHTETLVWTAGNSPHPLIRRLGLEADARGAAATDPSLRVAGHPNVWALGDCAAVFDSRTGDPSPPTAQHALRQAQTLARNIHAVIRDGKTRPFSYRSLGSFAVLGHQTACAEIRGFRFSGLFAWWLWRTIYLMKLPTAEKKVRVAVDWTVDLFFARDIVQTMSWRQPERGGGREQSPFLRKNPSGAARER